MKTTELIGLSLNWAVESALGGREPILINPKNMPKGIYRKGAGLIRRNPSASDKDGGPIIDAFHIGTQYLTYGRQHWGARIQLPNETYDQAKLILGPTRLIAAMRCFCFSQFGEDIEVPPALLEDDVVTIHRMDAPYDDED